MYIKKMKGPVIANLDEPLAETTSGKVRGVWIDGTYMFRSIRYGNAERFHMPRRADAWEGIDPCIIYQGVCPELDAPVPSDNFYVPHMFYRYDEDCLTLNVWTRSMEKDAKKPVMVWLHGGGYAMGSAIELYSYDGENLAAFGDVVVVTVNHRLNVLGYLDLSEFGEEYVNSGNAGIMDLVEALKWVRDNIAGFGGDPDNVTLFGQSGGGGKIMSLMQTPAADGLYHKACIQSAVSEGIGMAGKDQRISRAITRLVLKHAGLPENLDGVHALEKLPYDELAKAANAALKEARESNAGENPFAFGFDPVANEFMLGSQMTDGFRKENLQVPLMVGTVFGEFSNNLAFPSEHGSKNWWDDELKKQLLKERFGEDTDTLIEAFGRAYPEKNCADLLYIDTMFRRGTLAYVNKRSEVSDAPVFNYQFNFEFPFNNGSIAFHNAEIGYVFHNADYLEAYYKPGVTEKLQDEVAGAWVSFARTGSPSRPELPWEPVKNGNGACMVFDETSACRYHHDEELMKLLPKGQSIVPKR